MPAATPASRSTVTHSSGNSVIDGSARRRVVRNVAHREQIERKVVMAAAQRRRSGKDHIGVAGGLVDVDVETDHEVELGQRGVETPAVGGGEDGIAGHRDQGADLTLPAVSISSARHTTGSSPNTSPRPRTRLAKRPKRVPRPRPGCPRRWHGRRRRAGTWLRPRRSRFPVRTLSTSTSQLARAPNSCVQVPIRPYDRRGRCRRQLACHPADLLAPRSRIRAPPPRA